MASGTNYSQEYEQAEKAYSQGDFAQAAATIDHLAEEFPNDPHVLLLRGHIYCYGFQNYDLAQQQYETVLGLSEEQEVLDFARSGIEQARQLQAQLSDTAEAVEDNSFADTEDSLGFGFSEEHSMLDEPNDENYDDSSYGDDNYGFELEDVPGDSAASNGFSSSEEDFENPFSLDNGETSEDLAQAVDDSFGEDPFTQMDSMELNNSDEEPDEELSDISFGSFGQSPHKNSTFMVEEDEETSLSGASDYPEDDLGIDTSEYADEFDDRTEYADDNSELEVDTVLTEPFAMDDAEDYSMADAPEQDGLDYQDELEFDEIDSSFFDLEELEQGLPDTGLFNVAEEPSSSTPETLDSDAPAAELGVGVEDSGVIEVQEEIGTTTATSANLDLEVEPEVKQGAFAGFINAPMQKKQFITAGATGLVSTIAVLGIGLIGTSVLMPDSENKFVDGAKTSGLLALVAGITSFGTATVFGKMTARQVEKASRDLQTQFDDVYQGNLNAKATVYAQDEFGQLATGFNRMTRVILTTTQEAQRRAEETEQAKEDLQRQVIRLLDDVEGAARGDLTVQATVTADVLGAVADAFNLTIQSLREIVRQVKEAAEKVNQGSTDSELFARNQSSEALRMAEELAVTLNSVQMMTESIERVAENAREAEEVARSSSVTALKGGKAVERTVAGIFQIRETVSETARKVKRLAEASQEISKIVLLISQIAERTNQLALNASIQAAKAGEAGRGFAVVADEVRQLADRSGKSLKEIEQIVLQIQSETGSVMTAMEEGIQEVIDVTDRAEQAKTALEDIIQVSNRIDTLVRSITADTVEQRENSRAVAQVMQSVELTAQATSQESQRVAGALQSLVSIARGLLSSVERFRIDKDEE